MIAWLEGVVQFIDEQKIVINCKGVGYEVSIGQQTLLKLNIALNSNISLPIYTSVKEDEISLLGFSDFQSRKMFTLLINVNGIGPKAGLNIIDTLDFNTIYQAIQSHNSIPFLSVSGIGKKTAQKIVIDLEEKIKKLNLNYSSNSKDSKNTPVSPLLNNTFNDAKSALINLGFSDRDVDQSIRNHFQPEIELNLLIKKSLQELSKLKK